MVLPSAPCPKCRAVIVMGQRQCLRCHERFDYGANPPPEPTMQQIQEVWAQIQSAAPAAPSPPAPANPAHPTSAHQHPGAMQVTPAAAAPQPATMQSTTPATANVTNVGQQSSGPQTQSEPQASFIERGRYELETSSAQQLDVSLQGIFEPTAFTDSDSAEAPTASLPGLEITSFEPETPEKPGAAGAPNGVAQTARCVDCAVAYVSGLCPSCGRVAH